MMLTAHTLTFLGIHISHRPLGLHQSYIHCTQRLPIMSCSAAGGRYVGPLTARSNTLCHIKTDAALTSLPGPPALMMLTLYEGRSMFIEVTQASRPSLKVLSTAMKSCPAYCTRVHIVCEILQYLYHISL